MLACKGTVWRDSKRAQLCTSGRLRVVVGYLAIDIRVSDCRPSAAIRPKVCNADKVSLRCGRAKGGFSHFSHTGEAQPFCEQSHVVRIVALWVEFAVRSYRSIRMVYQVFGHRFFCVVYLPSQGCIGCVITVERAADIDEASGSASVSGRSDRARCAGERGRLHA